MSLSIQESSSRTRSDSLDDSELPEQDRKRPRLNFMHSDAIAESSLYGASVGPQPLTEGMGLQSGKGDQPAVAAACISTNALATSPTSKVTINTKNPQSHASAQFKSQPMAESDGKNVTANGSESETSSKDQIVDEVSGEGADGAVVPPETISISSSASRSPEIEVADVEDFDQDPAQTRWIPLAATTRNRDSSGTLPPYFVYQTFPLAQSVASLGSCEKAIAIIGNYFHKGHNADGQLFSQVKSWLSDLLRRCSRLDRNTVSQEAQFWRDFPTLITSLLQREIEPPDGANPQDLEDFFVDFAGLAVLMIRLDVNELREYTKETNPDDIEELYSRTYIPSLGYILQYLDIPFYDVLARSRSYNARHLITSVVDRLADPSSLNMLCHLRELLYELGKVLPRKPSFAIVYPSLLSAVSPYARSLSKRNIAGSETHDADNPSIEAIKEGSLQLFRLADEILEQAIVKQFQWLTIENSTEFVRVMSTFAFQLSDHLPHFRLEIINNSGLKLDDFSLEDREEVTSFAWKFKTLRKYITHGRMEIRVQGIEIMQGDLVTVYNRYILNKREYMSVPLVRFLVKFIQDTKLINYIVGVDSHPQLISRSANIVGFLCVTGTYSFEDTDTIWRAVTDGQDSRTVIAVLELLKSDFNMLDSASHNYICRKLLVLPMQQFSEPMLGFTVKLIDCIRQSRLVGGPRSSQDPVALELCTRMLRDINTESNCSFDQVAQIRCHAEKQLELLLQPAWIDHYSRIEPAVQLQQWKQFADDIADNTPSAIGSIQAMNVWLDFMPHEDAFQLLQDFKIPDLLVNNISYISSSLPYGDTHGGLSQFEFDVRLSALRHLILRTPQLLSVELIETLWKNLFTAAWVPDETRESAWQVLSGVIANCQIGHNPVLDTVIDHYIPRLTAPDFTEAVLNFIQFTVKYEIKQRGLILRDDESVDIPGIERIWRIMLEAAPGTVEAQAIDFMIHEYLDNALIAKRTKESIRATHLSLVDRCVRQVISSASALKSFSEDANTGEDEDRMTILETQDEILREELRFDRSLLFLRKLLEGMKARPRYSPPLIESPHLLEDTFQIRGDRFELNLQIFGSNDISSEPKQLPVGAANSGGELWLHLSKMTGFRTFFIIFGGKKINLKDEMQTLKELGLGPGRLIVSRIQHAADGSFETAMRSHSPMDHRVMDHFQELYVLLDLDERLAREVYAFLSLFPPQRSLLDLVKSKEADPEELLPGDRPYRLLYSASALRSCLEAESFNPEPDVEFLRYGIRTIVSTFPRLESTEPPQSLEIFIAQSLLESLLLALRAKASPDASRSYIAEPDVFARHLLRLARNGQNCVCLDSLQMPVHMLVHEPLDVLVEGVLHDERVWQALQSLDNTRQIVKDLILCDHRNEVRKAVVDIILALAGPSGAKLILKVNDSRAARSRFPPLVLDKTLYRIWILLTDLLPEVINWPFQCQELFEACLAIMRRIGKTLELSETRSLFEKWASLLMAYQHKENVGSTLDDYVVRGFAKLLQESCKNPGQDWSPDSGRTLAHGLVSKFLFPRLPQNQSEERVSPILRSTIREELYDLVLLLNPKLEDIDKIVDLLEGHVSKNAFPQSFLGYDRQSLRTEVGYAGLRNLSNTCYLNSLFSQLFMNADFRNLIIHVNIVDPTKQALVSELAKLFANMQESYEKFVDPSSAVGAILIPSFSGKEEHIDVAVQMDVDEFYNILFDQVEQQILDGETKTRFKTIYGGQLVQQVKSKECEHISERSEPFSSIQIEIKGKKDLEEGLRAYVEGEVLQGDNKYSCTSCGRHVDAVKRACLKEVPDNLIFNLKRFDYDIMSGMRCKVNDEFAFPDVIDIAPYTVAYLSNPEGRVKSDVFELTGVIVHAGTADSGHYYSYIRQRPSLKDKRRSWVQFNDVDVTVFDPMTLKDTCFGGLDVTSALHWPKIYSAYMLFYQRTASIEEFERKYAQLHDSLNPLRLPLSQDLTNQLYEQNEQCIRRYCAQDPSHAKFIRELLQRIQLGEYSSCTYIHRVESKLLCLALDYIYQVSGRWKDHPEFEITAKILHNNAQKCVDCAQTIVEWYAQGSVPQDTLVRCPYNLVRRTWSALIGGALDKVSRSANTARITNTDEDLPEICDAYTLILQRLMTTLSEDIDSLLRYGRCWDQYFEFMRQILDCGPQEVLEVLEAGYLPLTLDLVLMHVGGGLSRALRAKYIVYLSMKEKNRSYHYVQLLEFLADILEWIELGDIAPDESRPKRPESFGLTFSEATKLGLTGQPPKSGLRLEWLRRAILGRQNPKAIIRIIRKLITERTLQGLIRQVFNVLEAGLMDENVPNSVYFLEPTALFCRECPSRNSVMNMVQTALEGIESIGERHGKEHFDLILTLTRIENEVAGINRDDFKHEVLNYVGSWGPVLLIHPNNDYHADVSQETMDFLHTNLFDPLRRQDLEPRQSTFLRRNVKRLVNSGASYVRKHYIDAAPKEKLTLSAGQANGFLQVMDIGLDLVFDESGSAGDEQRAAEIRETLDELRALADQAAALDTGSHIGGLMGGGTGVDGLSSDWQDGESDALSASEFENVGSEVEAEAGGSP